MKYSKDDIIKALECCSLVNRASCEDCPLKEECESNPFESILAKYTLEVINKLLYNNQSLTEQRDTFREYALQTQAMIEGISAKMNEGYEYSAARYAAEMDMWRAVALEKKRLEDENEQLRRRLYAKKNS